MAESIDPTTALHQKPLESVLDNLLIDITNVRAILAGVLSASTTFDPASRLTLTQELKTVAVTGATLGDFAIASFSLDLAGFTLSAYVSAVDTVTVVFFNSTAATVDLASGTLRVRVLPQATFAAPAALGTTT